MQTNDTTRESLPGAIKHPAHDEWMAYLYGEVPRIESGRLTAHLRGCAECRAKVGQWRETMGSLNEWSLAPARPNRAHQPGLRWAAAAAGVMILAFGLGWVGSATARTKDTASVRNELRQQLRAEFQSQWEQERKQLLAETSRVIEENRAQDSRAILAALRDVTAAHRADYDSLHNEMETMALMTENTLRQAQQQLVNLASAGEPNPQH